MKKVVAVSYLNTRPFTDGLAANMDAAEYSLQTMAPSACAAAYREGMADVALIPVAALSDPGFEGTVQDRFCIGARGKVDSVFVLSDVPIDRATALIMDGDSRTSNLLARLLAQRWWQIRPTILPPGTPRTQTDWAVVAIGDKAVPLKDKFRYGYDLAAEWAEYTAAKHGGALPFVFAVWVHRALEPRWLERWYAALEAGVAGAAESAKRWAGLYNMAPEKAEYYLTRSIDYVFDEPKQRALSLFLELSRVKVYKSK